MRGIDIARAHQHKQQDPPNYRDGGRRHAPAAGARPTPAAPQAQWSGKFSEYNRGGQVATIFPMKDDRTDGPPDSNPPTTAARKTKLWPRN
eukprot:scaffold459_cov117-Isochrysis_galbana.AAC.16